MTASPNFALSTLVQPGTRSSRLVQELSFALANAEPKMLAQWGLLTGKHFTSALGRRGRNLVNLVEKLVTHTAREGSAAVGAYRAGNLADHSKERASAAAELVTGLMKQVGAFGSTVASAVVANPKEAAPQLLTLVITSILVSGGPDGDGGAPDLDLMFGIDAHRSVLSHSVLMGAALEAGFLSIVELVRLFYERLPAGHDPVWDKIYVQAEEYSRAAQVGASLGMAYHLFVDGVEQVAPYKDLPVTAPIEAHQAIFVANAAAEVVDAGNKPGMSKFTGDRATEEKRHKQYRASEIVIRADVAELLTKDELNLIKRYGAWMLALSSGDIQALTPSQERFVEVAQGKRDPVTNYELAWRMYSRLTEILTGQTEGALTRKRQ